MKPNWTWFLRQFFCWLSGLFITFFQTPKTEWQFMTMKDQQWQLLQLSSQEQCNANVTHPYALCSSNLTKVGLWSETSRWSFALSGRSVILYSMWCDCNTGGTFGSGRTTDNQKRDGNYMHTGLHICFCGNGKSSDNSGCRCAEWQQNWCWH